MAKHASRGNEAAAGAPQTLTERTVALALAVGFDLAGVARAEPTPETRFLREWLARGYAGEMAYLARRAEARIDPRRVLPGARSCVALGFVYDPGRRQAAAPGSLGVARYAGGDDYHDILIDRLRAFETGLEVLAGRSVRTRGYVDTGPVSERVFAAYAGLGWIGKNTCLIHPRLGSYLFLGVVLTDLELEPDARAPDHCGTCRACLEACPTQAFAAPHVLDARRCIAYTTIESREPIPLALREGHGAWGFGCDICQEVCPWNRRARRSIPSDPLGLRARIAPRPEWLAPSLAWVLQLSEQAWRSAVRGTALRRARYRGLLRNALVVAGNSGDRALAPLLQRHAQGGDALLAEHARWALARLGCGAPGAAAPGADPERA
ncbi:MAG: tRNA epoxyqueuosine(34) reductase QueG [Myxococcales bacterium]|nr:tRNA epoxyqueuosine(34) reductase QueG [Myxococcales bacterium]MDH5566869.1 tRNA epoxyqueuosine(34) reductase QueG [Myxococcales bacterium]